ncbi:MAG: VacB/RNase II family 3'-5' exoribonuclease [Bdellovibrionales bacterium]|nr:VacB/RNase II family 3'-5' exoribonuclease [Bdellovibrionales bacterium]
MKKRKRLRLNKNHVKKNSVPTSSILDSSKDNERVLKAFNIPYEFYSVDEEKPISRELKKKDFQDRKDLRHLPFVTIDGIHAKDFDDAIYVEIAQKGWTAFISIADVSWYVKEKGNLDKEAYLRGNSTYFPDFVAPMLPFYLSQGLCSLNPHVPRLTMTVELHFDSNGNQKKAFFYESVICSQSRLTYEEAQDIIDGRYHVSSAVQSSIQSGAELAQVLMDRRFKKGALNLDLGEVEILIDSDGQPLNIVQTQRLFSHKLIEELMLACNQAVADFLSRKKIPAVYRVHENPRNEDLSHLNQFLQAVDSKANLFEKKKTFRKQKSLALQLSQFLSKMKKHPKKTIMHYLILRALPQAHYSAYNKGHFGLQFEKYLHFTSPIRRYSDLIVHRILKNVLKNSNHSVSDRELETTAQFLSQCEQRSVKAERFIEDIKKARFMTKYVGEEFSGTIASVTKFGFFVTLNEYSVDGLVHINNLGGRWRFHPSQLLLKAYPSGYTFRQGDEVSVRVAMSNVEEGQVDFELVEHKYKKFYQMQSSRSKKPSFRNRRKKNTRSQKMKKYR